MRNENIRNENGFSLVEVLVVIVIIAVLAALAITQFGDATARGRDAKAVSVTRAVASAQEAYYTTHLAYADDISKLPEVTVADLTVDLAAGNSGDISSSFRVTIKETGAMHSFTWTSDPAPGEPNLVAHSSGAGDVGNS